MPRRKQITLLLKDLNVFDEIVKILIPLEELAEYDLSTLKIALLKKKLSPKIIHPENAIQNLERYIYLNGNEGVRKCQLCKIMKISRPTLNKWIADGFIIPTRIQGIYNQLQIYNLKDIIDQLRKNVK